MKRKILSFLLTAAMVFTMLPMAAFAEETQPCNHVHDQAICGYTEGVDGAVCTHTHDATCGGLDSGNLSKANEIGHIAACTFQAELNTWTCDSVNCQCTLCIKTRANAGQQAMRITTLDLDETSLPYHKIGDAQGDPTGRFDPTSANSPADNVEGWSWDLASRTLTLSGFNLRADYEPESDNYGISSKDSLTIVLADGTSNLVETGGLEIANGKPQNFGIALVDSDGVNDNAVLTIRGGGSLNVMTGNGKNSYGIGAGSIFIGGTGDITVRGGSAIAASGTLYGIYASGVNDESGLFINTKPGDRANVTSFGGNGGASNIGIESTVNFVVGGGVVKTTGGSGVGFSYGIDANNIEITGGTVYAYAGPGTGGQDAAMSAGINASASDAETNPSVVKISGGTVYATGNESYRNSYGISAQGNNSTEGQVIISGGTVYATGGTTNKDQYEGCSSYGIYAGGAKQPSGVIVTGGNVTAVGGTSNGNSYGIYADDLVSLLGGRVSARSGSAPTVSTAVQTASPVADPDDGSMGIVIGTGLKIIEPFGGVLDTAKQNILNNVGGTIASYAMIGVPTPSGGGGGSSSGGGTKSPLLKGSQGKTAISDVASKPATAAQVNKLTEATLSAAKANNSKTATVALSNTSSVSLAIMKQVAEAAKKSGIVTTLTSDVRKGNVVESRIYIDPSKAMQDMKLGVTLGDKKLDATLAKLIGNNVLQVVSLEQEGALGMPVKMAVYLNGKTLDLKTLQLYSYDAKTNQITPVANAECTIDANGYLRFTTNVGGTLVAAKKK